MTGTILDKILDARKLRVDAAKKLVDKDELIERALYARSRSVAHRFRNSFSSRNHLNIIAEFKKASPSKGSINEAADPAEIARQYQLGGAAAMSVLTEEDFFKGSIDDLRTVQATVDLPILRKDFIFDVFQIYEGAAAGADAVLLIAAMLDDAELKDLRSLAEDELNMDALIEVHTLPELERISNIGSKLIGVNNRDLHSFHVSLDVSRDLIKHAPPDAVMIAESGLKKKDDLLELHKLGFSVFLIGETLMTSDDASDELRKLLSDDES